MAGTRRQRRNLLPGRGIGLLIFVCAFLLRLIYILQARANPQFAAPLMDPGFHDEWAWQLATGTWQAKEPFFRAPLYPLFLAGIYALAGHQLLVPRLIQAALGAGSCVLIYLIGARLLTRAAGIVAGFGAAAYWILIYFDGELLIPVLFVFLTLCFFFSLLRCLELDPTGAISPRATIWGALGGACFGLAAITRPSILIFLPALVWVFWRARRAGLPGRAAIAFALVCLIPIAAVTSYNALVGDDFVVIASQGGVNFYIGNNAESDGVTAVVPGTRADWWGGRFDTIKIAERAVGRPLKASEVSAYWFRRALRFIADRPIDWARLTARKFALFWSAAEIGNNASIAHQRSYAPLMALPLPGFGLVAPLALAGIYLALRRRSRERGVRLAGLARPVVLPLLFIVLYMLGVVAFFVCARYRVPILPFLILFAAYAVTETIGGLRRGERGGLLPAALIFLAALAAVHLPARAYEENVAQAHFHDGIAYRRLGKTASAEQALREALRINPELAAARNNLANLLAESGDAGSARGAYRNALTADPHNAKAWANLASLELDAGDLAAADSAVARALAIDPDHSEALRILGVIREQRGDLGGAREAYLRALEFTRERHRIENNLGLLARREGRLAEAEAHLRLAVQLAPSYLLAWNNLAALLVDMNRLADAVEPLRKVAALDPDSQTAWSNLAQVLAHLGRTAEADAARRRAAALGR